MKKLVLLVAVVLAAAACGDDDSATTTTAAATTTAAPGDAGRVAVGPALSVEEALGTDALARTSSAAPSMR